MREWRLAKSKGQEVAGAAAAAGHCSAPTYECHECWQRCDRWRGSGSFAKGDTEFAFEQDLACFGIVGRECVERWGSSDSFGQRRY